MTILKPEKSTLLPGETSLVKIFSHRKVYKEKDSIFDTGIQLLDITESRQLYGRVNIHRRAIYPSETNLATIQSTQSTQSMYLLDFVAKAFKDMRGYMKRAALSKRINYEKSLLFNLQPAAGWASPQRSFFSVMDAAYTSFYNIYIRKNNINESIVDFPSFMKVFTKFATSMSSQFKVPCTFTGFLGHGMCPPHTSGLLIDLYEFDHNNDSIKNELFLRDDFFVFFKDSAKKFGFVIDKNAPWRMIADLSSMPMKKYMYESGLTYKSVFKEYYYESIDYDIDLLKEYTVGFYNTLVEADPVIRRTEYCKRQNKTLSTLIERLPVTMNSLDKKYDISYWAEKYLLLRAAETNSKMDAADVRAAKRNIFIMSRVVDTRRIMVYIDDLVQRNTGIEMNIFKQDNWKDFVYTPALPVGITLPVVEYDMYNLHVPEVEDAEGQTAADLAGGIQTQMESGETEIQDGAMMKNQLDL